MKDFIILQNENERGINNDIILSYYEKLKNIIPKHCESILCIHSIRNHTEIAFNCNPREILYAIQACFNGGIDKVYYDTSTFKENLYGKVVTIKRENATKDVDFSKFFLYYKYYFKKRIELIERHFVRYSIYYSDILEEKNNIINDYITIYYIKELPYDIKKYIHEFLNSTIKTLFYLRSLYQNRTRKIE